MAGANHSSGNRANSALFFLITWLLLTFSNAATAGATCYQACDSNTFFGDRARKDGDAPPPDPPTGSDNSAFGRNALLFLTSGNYNFAFGASSQKFAYTGSYNTASGAGSLSYVKSNNFNTATGYYALFGDGGGIYNTAIGRCALSRSVGGNDTAIGVSALTNTGSDNSATGANAMYSGNNQDHQDTADGTNALYANRNYENTGTGMNALLNNDGYGNTADGYGALSRKGTGYSNTGLGFDALYNNTTGQGNLAVGANAGLNLTTGSNNIDIGASVPGVAGEANTIRLGAQGTQKATYIAGIAGTRVTGADVVVNSSSGQLGVVASSVRYKKDIKEMGASSDSLTKLRPVTFRYKNDEQGTTQYGLVAEEVEKVYPELVTYGADGKVETVRYSTLTSMLLNEVQKQAREKQELAAQMAELKASRRMQIAQLQGRHEQELQELRAVLEARLSTIEHAIRTRDGNGTLTAALDE